MNIDRVFILTSNAQEASYSLRLCPIEWQALGFISHTALISGSQLAAKLNVSVAGVEPVIARLMEVGLVHEPQMTLDEYEYYLETHASVESVPVAEPAAEPSEQTSNVVGESVVEAETVVVPLEDEKKAEATVETETGVVPLEDEQKAESTETESVPGEVKSEEAVKAEPKKSSEADAVPNLRQSMAVFLASSAAETPAAETPAVETPAVETPAVETPAVETPAVETPAAETPAVETPAAETPVAETPGAETPVAETTAVETPGAETPAVETPAAETPVAETPVAETTAVETSEAEKTETAPQEVTPVIPEVPMAETSLFGVTITTTVNYNLGPLFDFVRSNKGDGLMGQLALYRLLLHLPQQLLEHSAWPQIELLSNSPSTTNSTLKIAFEQAAEEIVGKPFKLAPR